MAIKFEKHSVHTFWSGINGFMYHIDHLFSVFFATVWMFVSWWYIAYKWNICSSRTKKAVVWMCVWFSTWTNSGEKKNCAIHRSIHFVSGLFIFRLKLHTMPMLCFFFVIILMWNKKTNQYKSVDKNTGKFYSISFDACRCCM